jgi:hypothetical protein
MLAFYRPSPNSVPGKQPAHTHRIYERQCCIEAVSSKNSAFLLLIVVTVFHMTGPTIWHLYRTSQYISFRLRLHHKILTGSLDIGTIFR